MKFLKMHGLGNDFIIVDQWDKNGVINQDLIKHTCDRRRGVGCDQFIVLEKASKGDVFMRIYNPDGSEAEACGNATRCVAHYYMQEQAVDYCVVETVAGLLECTLKGDHLVQVNMGTPKHIEELDLQVEGLARPMAVNMGNPHCVFIVDDLESIDLKKLGSFVETHSLFPNKTNVEFVSHLKDNEYRVRVWERGAGVTQACGSGACASGVAIVQMLNVKGAIGIEMDGGRLEIEYRQGENVLMTGPVAYVFEGNVINE